MSVDRDPVTCLVEIAVLTMNRMNTGTDISPDEAFTLGQINGIAGRVPVVLERLRELESRLKEVESQ